MKLITAVVQPFMLTKVAHALEALEGFPGMTVSDVRGFGREKHDHSHGIDDLTDFVNKVRIDVAARDDMAQRIVDTIAIVARTGNRGDGKIFVQPLEVAVRIKTREEGEAAVS